MVWRFSHSKNPAKKFSEALLAIKPVYNPLRVDPGDSARNADLEDVDFHSVVNGTQFLPVWWPWIWLNLMVASFANVSSRNQANNNVRRIMRNYPKRCQNDAKLIPKWPQNDPRSTQKWSKIIPKSPYLVPKMVPKWPYIAPDKVKATPKRPQNEGISHYTPHNIVLHPTFHGEFGGKCRIRLLR